MHLGVRLIDYHYLLFLVDLSFSFSFSLQVKNLEKTETEFKKLEHNIQLLQVSNVICRMTDMYEK